MNAALKWLVQKQAYGNRKSIEPKNSEVGRGECAHQKYNPDADKKQVGQLLLQRRTIPGLDLPSSLQSQNEQQRRQQQIGPNSHWLSRLPKRSGQGIGSRRVHKHAGRQLVDSRHLEFIHCILHRTEQNNVIGDAVMIDRYLRGVSDGERGTAHLLDHG